MTPDVFASVGFALSVVSNLPQVYRVRNKNTTKDIHPLSVVIHVVCCAVWSYYGYLLELWILCLESFLVFLCWVYILLAIARDRIYEEAKQLTINTPP